ncbi:hypothetical protein [Streptomyces sp. NPDC054887]
MQGDDAGGQSAADRARDLQPSGRLAIRDLGAPVSADDLRQMPDRHSRKAEQLQRSIDRRMNDKQLLDLLAQDGYQGRRYDQFINELIRYGMSVLRGWMYSGFIFQLVANRGYSLNPTEFDLDDLASDSELREQLATMTVACALPRFRQRALLESGWTFEGGASIATYFMGACAYDFPNEFRRHRVAHRRQRLVEQRQKETHEIPPRISVADEVLGNMEALDRLKTIKDLRARAIVALTSEGYSQEEIRLLVNAKSVRGVEGVLYRLRMQMKRDREEGDQDGQPPAR